MDLILTLCTIYSLPCVILTNEGVTCGLDLARVALDLNLKKGLKCKFEKNRTFLQLKKNGPFLKELKNLTVSKRIGTNLQKYIIFGLNCNF